MSVTKDSDLPSFEKATAYDEFNMPIPENVFPRTGMSARAAQAITVSDTWTDANPAQNMSSFVTTFAEEEAIDIARRNMFKNYIDHDMYPQCYAMEKRMVRWLHELFHGPKDTSRMARRRSARRKRACLAVSRTSGIGARRGRRPAKIPRGPTS